MLLLTSCLLGFSPPTFSGNDCPTDRIDQKSKVKYVFDGDTLQLANGDKVRLIGINTPEMNFDTNNPEPLAEEARKFLSDKVLNQSINLRLDTESKDHYGRKLAHIFLLDGTNIQAEIIRHGLAFSIAIPPNLWQQNCYQLLEKHARQQQIGLWKIRRFNPIDAKEVNHDTLGFYQVKGTIHTFKKSSNAIWLNLSDAMAVRINQENYHHFPDLSEKYWQGKSIIVKGWISEKKKRYSMRINHPSAIEIQ